MPTSLIDMIREGGCYWKKQPNSPGHSIAIPNETPFKIAVEGAQGNGDIPVDKPNTRSSGS